MGVEYSPPFEHSSLSSPVSSPMHDYVTAEATILVGVLVVFYLTVILLLFGSNLACPRSLFAAPRPRSKSSCEDGSDTTNNCDTCLDIDGNPREGESQKQENDSNQNTLKDSLKVYRGSRNGGSKHDYCSIDLDDDFESDRAHVDTCKMCLKDANESDEFVDTDESDDDEYCFDDTLVVDRKGEYSLSYSKKQCNDEDEINWDNRTDKRAITGIDSRSCRCEEQRYESLRGHLDFKRYQKLYHIENQETIAIRQEKLRYIEQQLREQSKPLAVDDSSVETRSEDSICECMYEYSGQSSQNCTSLMPGHLRSKSSEPSAAMRPTEVNEALALVHYPHNRVNYTGPHTRACKCTTVIHSDTYIGRTNSSSWRTKRDGYYAKEDLSCEMCQEFCRKCFDGFGAGNGNEFKNCNNFKPATRVFSQEAQSYRAAHPSRSVTSSSLNRWASSYESPPAFRPSMRLSTEHNTRQDLKTSTSDSFLSSHIRSCKVCTTLSSSKINASDQRFREQKIEPDTSLDSFQKLTREPNYFGSKFTSLEDNFSSKRETCDYLDTGKPPKTIDHIIHDQKNDSETPCERDSLVRNECEDVSNQTKSLDFKKSVTETATTFSSVRRQEAKEENELEKPKDFVEVDNGHSDANDKMKVEQKIITEVNCKEDEGQDASHESALNEPVLPLAKIANVRISSPRTVVSNSMELEVVLLEEKSGHVSTHVASPVSV
ncbi:hypothetical protein FHG87_007553 [Trinorchestia longiramus]|nr:hypothetical protein FHG87_007553 [Trinorchestia longiramus]